MAVGNRIRLSLSVRRSDFAAIRRLLDEVWLVPEDLAQYQIQAYREHFWECRKVKDDTSIASEKVSDIIKLCEEVNGCLSLSLDDAHDKIRSSYTPGAAQQQLEDRSVQQAISFAARLCLFVPLGLELRRSPKSTKQILRDRLASCTAPGPNRTLKDDFCEKNLTRRANFKIRYTSNLMKHLELQGNQLFVFRHGTAMRSYAGDCHM